MRILDHTLTDMQLKGMAKEIKNSSNKIDIIMMLQNLVGNEFETVDFRNRVFKRIYSELNDKRNYDALARAFNKHDTKFDGTLSILEMRNALRQVLTSIDDTTIEKFIKFLEKDKRGRINYTEFLNKMNDVSN